MQVRPNVASSTVLLDLTTENGGIALGGINGTVSVHATAAMTQLVTGKSAVYDIEIIAPGGAVKRLIMGTIAISPEVTR